MSEVINNIVFIAIMTMVAMLIFSGCTTKATLQERIDCRQACTLDGVRGACSDMFWTICDCVDGKRIRISR